MRVYRKERPRGPHRVAFSTRVKEEITDKPIINYGFNDLYYEFSNEDSFNEELSFLLDQCCHVFRAHADGNWKTLYKQSYVKSLSVFIEKRPSLIRKLLALKDPVIQNITHAALQELEK